MVAEFSGTRVLGEHSAIDRLRLRLRGELIQPDSDTYETARTLYWATYDRRPSLIVQAEDEIDVIAAVDYARETGTPLAVRSGGHGFAGHAMVEGGIVVDLSRMRSIRIDPVARTARVQPGLTWKEYGEAAQAHGLATTSGDVGSVGVGGLTVGGGVGWMVRKYGLTIDHLLSFDIVTADGRLLRASKDEHADLFWAVRGGGGNFGIITSLEFRLQPAGMVLGGGVFYSGKDAERIIREAAAYAAQAPDELTVMVMVMNAPPAPFIPAERVGELSVLVALCYVGGHAEGERVIAPLRNLGEPIAELIGPMPYPGMFALTEDLAKPGKRLAVRSAYLNEVTDETAEAIVRHMRRSAAPFAMAQLRVLGGAMARVPASETAFGHRDKQFMLSAITEWLDPAEDEWQLYWVERFYGAFKPQAAGVYVNFLQDEGEARIRDAYKPAVHQRLAAVKASYDPANFFRRNQNIKPVK